MALETSISKAGGGLAFEVILKPANSEAPPAIIAGSPTKERSISQEIIEKKLKEAEERRISLEASRLQPIIKDKERAQDVTLRAQELNDSFARETEKKLQEKMEAQQEKKNAQIKAKLDRLSQHDLHVEKVRINKLQNQSSTDEKENGEVSPAAE